MIFRNFWEFPGIPIYWSWSTKFNICQEFGSTAFSRPLSHPQTSSYHSPYVPISAIKLKLSEEEIAVNLCDFGLGNGFLKAQTTEQKEKLDIIKIKNLCFKEHCQENEKTATEWERYL